MCFYVQSKNKDPKIAKRDIVCYKIFRTNDIKTKHVLSLYQDFKYRYGVLYELDGYINPITRNKSWGKGKEQIIEVGLHSYSSKRQAQKEINGYFVGRRKIYECTIPKGSTYYYNSDRKEYVSDQIIINKQIN